MPSSTCRGCKCQYLVSNIGVSNDEGSYVKGSNVEQSNDDSLNVGGSNVGE